MDTPTINHLALASPCRPFEQLGELLIDQGDADEFLLAGQLRPEALRGPSGRGDSKNIGIKTLSKGGLVVILYIISIIPHDDSFDLTLGISPRADGGHCGARRGPRAGSRLGAEK